jgi:hypothetical protein
MTRASWSGRHQRAQPRRASMIGLRWFQLGISAEEGTTTLSVPSFLDYHLGVLKCHLTILCGSGVLQLCTAPLHSTHQVRFA